MLSVRILLVLSFLLSASACAEEPVSVPESLDKFHLFLLIGQSNMAGRGVVEDSDKVVNPHVLMLNKKGEWVPAVDPLHFDKPSIVGVGLGRTFGLDYAAAHPDVTVGLIPCAVGGSAIESWEPGGFDDATKTHPYDDAMVRAHDALKAGTLRGILWHQGESDSTPERAAVYEQKLHALIQRLRTELAPGENDATAATIPFVAGQMGQFSERPWDDAKKQVDGVHRNLPSAVPATGFANSDGLMHKGDEVHFDSASAREFGHRYYRAWEGIDRK
jgi:pimeloyl-ACP methyl ester carboxylesterase